MPAGCVTPWRCSAAHAERSRPGLAGAQPDHAPCMCGDEVLIDPAANHGVSTGHTAAGTNSRRVVDHRKSLDRPAAMVHASRRGRDRCGGQVCHCLVGGGRRDLMGGHGYLGLSNGPVSKDRPRSRAYRSMSVRPDRDARRSRGMLKRCPGPSPWALLRSPDTGAGCRRAWPLAAVDDGTERRQVQSVPLGEVIMAPPARRRVPPHARGD